MQFLGKIIDNMTHLRQLYAMAVLAALMLAAAFLGQYVLGWHPCHLCILQRWPYAAIVAIGFAGYFLKNKPHIQQALIIVGALLFLTTSGIAAYHTAVEMKWIAGPSGCTSESTAGMTLEEMRKQLMEAPLVSCDQAMAYIFGLSLAAWNMIGAFILALGSFWLSRRIKSKSA